MKGGWTHGCIQVCFSILALEAHAPAVLPSLKGSSTNFSKNVLECLRFKQSHLFKKSSESRLFTVAGRGTGHLKQFMPLKVQRYNKKWL